MGRALAPQDVGANGEQIIKWGYQQILQFYEQLVFLSLKTTGRMGDTPDVAPIQELYQLIIAEAEQLFAGRAILWLADIFETSEITNRVFSAIPPASISKAVLENQQICYRDDLSEGERPQKENPVHIGSPESGQATEIALPVWEIHTDVDAQPGLLGVLQVFREQGPPFSAAELELLDYMASQIGAALQLDGWIAREKQRSAQLALLRQVSNAITSILDQDILFDQVAQLIRDRFGYPIVHIFSVYKGRRRVIYEAGSSDQSLALRQARLAYDLDDPQGMITWVARNGQILVAADVRQEPRHRPAPFKSDRTLSELCVPLSFGGEVLGVLDVQSEGLDAFHEQDIYILETLADQIAIAMRNATLYRSERWRRQVADSLREVAGLLAADVNLDQVLDSILTELERNLPCDLATIWLLDREGVDPPDKMGDLRLAALHSLGPLPIDLEIGVRLSDILAIARELGTANEQSIAETWLMRALDSDEPVIRPPAIEGDPLGYTFGFSEDYSAIATRLQVGDSTLGVLTLSHHTSGRYGAEARAMSAAFANYAAVAIHNTRIYEAAHEQAWISTVLLQVGEATQSTADLEEFLDTVIHITPMLAGVKACLLYLLEDDKTFVPVVSSGLNLEQQVEFQRSRFSKAEVPAIHRLVDEGRATLLDEESDDWRMASILYAGIDATSLFEEDLLILVPLIAHGEVLGGFLVDYSMDLLTGVEQRKTGDFFDRHLPIIQGIAHQTAIAIDNARLLKAQKEEAYVSVALLQIAQAVVSQRELSDALEAIVRITPILIALRRVLVYLYDTHSDLFELAQAWGLPHEFEGVQFVRDEFPLLDAVRERDQVIAFPAFVTWDDSEDIHDAWVQYPVPGADETQISMSSEVPLVIALPLSIQADVFGVIVVEESELIGDNLYTGTSSFARLREKRVEILTGVSQQASLAVQNARLQEEIIERERLEREMQLARQIQRTFLPGKPPEIPGWDIDVRWQTARQVGGDFYDYFTLPDQTLGLVIADVADKGMPAALYMTLVRTLIRATAQQYCSPAKVLDRVNEILVPDSEGGMFVTVFYATLDLSNGELVYTNAGHNPPLWITHSGEITPLVRSGMALGVMEGTQIREQAVLLAPGDYLILYTDGLTEAVSSEGELYGDQRLEETLREIGLASGQVGLGSKDLSVPNTSASILSASALIESLDESVSDFIGETPRADDLTLLVLHYRQVERFGGKEHPG